MITIECGFSGWACWALWLLLQVVEFSVMLGIVYAGCRLAFQQEAHQRWKARQNRPKRYRRVAGDPRDSVTIVDHIRNAKRDPPAAQYELNPIARYFIEEGKRKL